MGGSKRKKQGINNNMRKKHKGRRENNKQIDNDTNIKMERE